MNGVIITGALLHRHAPLVAEVRPASIKAGRLAEGTPLPAILIHSVSVTDRQTLAREAMVRSSERVAVTVRTDTWEQMVRLMKLVRTACTGVTEAQIEDARRIAVTTAGMGPEISSPNIPFERTQHLTVTYDSPA